MYKIKLEKFEGPLDLLLFFVRKDELNIYDIPIAHITKSYLEYLKMMQDLNLDIASEFILMAATLMRIKVRCMLPPEPGQENEEEPLDPREELTRRLIEYRQFKDASKNLSDLDDQWRMVYRRNYFNTDRLPPSEEAMGLKSISFFDLLAAYKKAISKTTEVVYHNVERLNVTVEEQIEYITNFFSTRNGALFSELCEGMCKIEIVVTFLALLDMIRREALFVRQSSVFDDIWIQTDRPDDYDAMLPEKISDESHSADSSAPEEHSTSNELTVPAETAEFELSGPISDGTGSVEAEETELIPAEPVIVNEQTFPENLNDQLIDISVLTDQLKSTDSGSLPSLTETDDQDNDTAESTRPVSSEDTRDQWIDDIQETLKEETANDAYEDVPEQNINVETEKHESINEITSIQTIEDSVNRHEDRSSSELTIDSEAEIEDDQFVNTTPNDDPENIVQDNENSEYDSVVMSEFAAQDHLESSEIPADNTVNNEILSSANMEGNTEVQGEFELTGRETADIETADDKENETVHSGGITDESVKEVTDQNEMQQDSVSYKEADVAEEDSDLHDHFAADKDVEPKIEDASLISESEPSKTEVTAQEKQAAELTSINEDHLKSAEHVSSDVAHAEKEGTHDAGISVDKSVSGMQEDQRMTDDKIVYNTTTGTIDEKSDTDDKDDDAKPSVFRKIFTSVISFVKKIFKRQ